MFEIARLVLEVPLTRGSNDLYCRLDNFSCMPMLHNNHYHCYTFLYIQKVVFYTIETNSTDFQMLDSHLSSILGPSSMLSNVRAMSSLTIIGPTRVPVASPSKLRGDHMG